MKANITIGERTIGMGFPVWIVAEISANHNQKFDQAVRLIEAAKEAGSDAVKLQTYTPDTLTIDADNEYFRIGKGSIWEGQTLYRLYQQAYTPWQWQPELKAIANNLGMELFATPFDKTAVSFLEKMDVNVFKISSFELVDIPLIRRVARTGKPIIFSTGMATLGEIQEAVSTAREAGCNDIVLLKCNSSYPANPGEMNLRTIPHMAKKFGVPVGVSDHTLDTTVAVAAVAIGACIVEKHFTLSRTIPGPDSIFSLQPDEFKDMVRAIRTAENARGDVKYESSEGEKNSRMFRRSLFVVNHIKAGELLTHENIRSIRPAMGLHPRYFEKVIGMPALQDIAKGTPLTWAMIRGPGGSVPKSIQTAQRNN